MAMFTFDKINSIFTQHVNNLIAADYVISMFGWNGRQRDEINHLYFTSKDNKGKLLALYLLRERVSLDPKDFNYISVLKFQVREYDYIGDDHVYWSNKGTLLKEIVFYSISDYANIYTDSLDEFKKISALQNKRFTEKNNNTNYCKSFELSKLSNKFRNSVLDKIHEVRGAKRANCDAIKNVTLVKDNNNKLSCKVTWEWNNKSGIVTYN